MIESFIEKNWRTILLLGFMLFIWFVWPTPYTPLVLARKPDGWNDFIKENRLTGKVYAYWSQEGIWVEDSQRERDKVLENRRKNSSLEKQNADKKPVDDKTGSALNDDFSKDILEKGTHSLHANMPTEMTFENKSGQTVRVYWLDYSGNRKLYRSLENGQQYAQKTFVTHPWLITGEDDRGWQIFFPDSQPRTVVILAPKTKL